MGTQSQYTKTGKNNEKNNEKNNKNKKQQKAIKNENDEL